MPDLELNFDISPRYDVLTNKYYIGLNEISPELYFSIIKNKKLPEISTPSLSYKVSDSFSDKFEVPKLNTDMGISMSLLEASRLHLLNLLDAQHDADIKREAEERALETAKVRLLQIELANIDFNNANSTKVQGDTYQERQALREEKRKMRANALSDLGDDASASDKISAAARNFGSNVALLYDFMRQSADDRMAIRAENRERRLSELGDDATGWQKFKAGAANTLSYAGTGLDFTSKTVKAGIQGLNKVATPALAAFNPGALTDLESDRNANMGLDAAKVLGQSIGGPYGAAIELAALGALTIGNILAKKAKPDFKLAADVEARLGASYLGLIANVKKRAQGPGLAGVLDGGASWENKWENAKAEADLMAQVDLTGADRTTASGYEGIGISNERTLGGYKQALRVKQGAKVNLDFAKKVVKAQAGLSFNSFSFVEPESKASKLNLKFSSNPEITSTSKPVTEAYDLGGFEALQNSGLVDVTENEGSTDIVVRDQALFSQLVSSAEFRNALKAKYPNMKLSYKAADDSTQTPPGNTPPGTSTLDDGIRPTPTITYSTVTPKPLELEVTADNVKDLIRHYGLLTELQQQLVREGAGKLGYTLDALNLYEPEKRSTAAMAGLIEYPTDLSVYGGIWLHNGNMYDPEKGVDAKPSEGYENAVQAIRWEPSNREEVAKRLGLNNINDVEYFEDNPEARKDFPNQGIRFVNGLWETREAVLLDGHYEWEGRLLKNGGALTITPFTAEEEALYLKEGGTFNVIPEGALHKNKHHMEDAEGLTKKGIPVVTIEDGKKIQQAEIELNEIIFRLEVTEELEKLAKEGTDEAAIKAGKLLVKEILHNTHDNTGLIEELTSLE